MNILIIGGAGFIGSHLCESYSNNHNVTSLDNYISGKKDNHINGSNILIWMQKTSYRLNLNMT